MWKSARKVCIQVHPARDCVSPECSRSLLLTASSRPQRKQCPNHCVRSLLLLGSYLARFLKVNHIWQHARIPLIKPMSVITVISAARMCWKIEKNNFLLPKRRWAVWYFKKQHFCGNTDWNFHKTNLVFQTSHPLSYHQFGKSSNAQECNGRSPWVKSSWSQCGIPLTLLADRSWGNRCGSWWGFLFLFFF